MTRTTIGWRRVLPIPFGSCLAADSAAIEQPVVPMHSRPLLQLIMSPFQMRRSSPLIVCAGELWQTVPLLLATYKSRRSSLGHLVRSQVSVDVVADSETTSTMHVIHAADVCSLLFDMVKSVTDTMVNGRC